ncbi:hypothetical protein GYH30_010143, partial [Glycine max]|uniref:N-acetyltransferase domain-containing protein n=1 Tax=Glycine max TaxID=3847 RepID=K7KKJ3_SOYBN
TSKSSQLEKMKKLSSKPPFPIYISTDPRHVDPHRLQDLFLRIALSHSSVLVSVFCNPQHVNAVFHQNSSSSSIADIFMPVSPSRDQLVRFGHALFEYGLTASIYDVMVIPSLQRMGIGQMIVKKIVRMLTNRDIYDIAALCSGNERLFFEACGFGDDILGSTTMMYRRTAPLTIQEGE